MNSIEILDIIEKNTVQITPMVALKDKLAKGVSLKIKLGVDPTSPDLHLGHAVVLQKLKDFQELGHEVIFLIGDFTARIGDPTGKNKTRPPLTIDDITHNMETYFKQVGRILNPAKLTVRYNSEWLSTLTMADLIVLCSRVTLAKITEREDFANRIAEHKPISLHEILYPLMQGYDSVALYADVELGGTDQTFNLLMGRVLQEQYQQESQVIITVPLLEGTDGVEKMSKSLGNAISFSETAENAFGKLMSISDTLMWRYMSILLRVSQATIEQMQCNVVSGTVHPMELKKDMATEIVSIYWSREQAQKAREQFVALFQQKDYSKATSVTLDTTIANPIRVIELLKIIGATNTSGEARRLIESGAVKIDGETITDITACVIVVQGMVIKAGKHRVYKIA